MSWSEERMHVKVLGRRRYSLLEELNTSHYGWRAEGWASDKRRGWSGGQGPGHAGPSQLWYWLSLCSIGKPLKAFKQVADMIRFLFKITLVVVWRTIGRGVSLERSK